MNPVDLVQRQLEAYNKRDLTVFLENFADDVQVFRLPLLEPSLSGKSQMAEFYANQRFNCPNLQAEILNRIVLGNKVFDHERISGVQDEPFEMVVVFEIQNNLIQNVFSFLPSA
jgi:hypothetical protein